VSNTRMRVPSGHLENALARRNRGVPKGITIRIIGTVLPAIEVGNLIPGRRVVAVLERRPRRVDCPGSSDGQRDGVYLPGGRDRAKRSFMRAGPARGIGSLTVNGE